jgi:protoporphyrinogen oxidase
MPGYTSSEELIFSAPSPFTQRKIASRSLESALKIAILGAGVTGLTLARLLSEDQHAVTVLEKARVPGGLCRSTVIDGFTCDNAGGHILFSKNNQIMDWMKDRVGRENLVETQRQTRILWHDRYVPYPFENGIGSLTPKARFDCLHGYLKAVEKRKEGVSCPQNFRDWIFWKMGDGLAKHFMLPYNEKIWECPLEEMDASWVAGRVPDAPVEDIIKAAVGWETKGYTHQSVFWFPKRGGFQALTDGIGQGLQDSILLETKVESLRHKGERFEVNGEDFDLVVNTIPLKELAEVYKEMDEGIREDCRKLHPLSVCTVLVGYKTDTPQDPLSWIYLPFQDQGPANRITFFSNYSPNNAPPGHASYMAEVTYRGESLKPNQEWLDRLVSSLQDCKLLKKSDVVSVKPFMSQYAYVDQNLAFPSRIARVRDWMDKSGVLTVGRFGRYEYHNSDQCIERAFQVHKHIQEFAKTGKKTPLSL